MDNLKELDESEFYDVYREFRPTASREEFAAEWAAFQRFKAAYVKRLGTQ